MNYKIILKSIIPIILGILVLSTSCYKDDGDAIVTIHFKGNNIAANAQQKHIIDRILEFFSKPAYAAWNYPCNRLTLTISGRNIQEQFFDTGNISSGITDYTFTASVPSGNDVTFEVLSYNTNSNKPNWGGGKIVTLTPGKQRIEITMIPITEIISAEQWIGTGNSVTIKFDNITSTCKGYNIYRSTEENSNYGLIGYKENTSGYDLTNSYEDKANLDINRTYYYKVSVIGNSGIEGLLCAVGFPITITANPNTAAQPISNPPAGEVAIGTPIELTTTTVGADIWYTTDGSTPVKNVSTKYMTPILITGATTIKAIASKTGMNDSAVLAAAYTIPAPGTVAKPMVNLSGGTVAFGTEITLSTTTTGADIYYTLDGSEPSSGILYSGPITLDTSGTITLKAIAVKAGMNNSGILVAAYTVAPGTVAQPISNPPAGEVAIGTPIELSTTTVGADIWYTTDGSTPVKNVSTKYMTPILITGATTIKAIASMTGMNDSAVFVAAYTIPAPGTVAQPMVNPSGGTETYGAIVTLSTTTSGADIYYTLDGNEPNSSSQLYTVPITLDTLGAVTLKAIAIKAGMIDSTVLVAAYTVVPAGPVDKPTANLPEGEVGRGASVTLSTTTSGADIWYTTDGSTPVKNGTGSMLYTSSISITINAVTTIKAIAVKTGWTDSEILVVEYAPAIPGMKWIKSGTFMMGQSDISNASPEHEVTLTKGFYMGEYQVTQDEYVAVMGTNPSNFTGTGDLPVEKVSWYDAIVFCNKKSIDEGLNPAYSISGSTDPDVWIAAAPGGIVPTISNTDWNAVIMVPGADGYRLPTEAEWEYACRAGTTTVYNTGSNDISNDTGWYNANSGSMTHEVGTKQPNAWGLYDMHGNVYEWCWDWYGSYSSTAQTDPTGAVSGSNRVMRGGDWVSDASYMRSAYRGGSGPYYRYYSIGFRVVRP
ncbi:MAG: chitobiase/beta-hexosaminidase C-terminal domain-containing protein [Leptospirales bacterium]|nr:chitobiase/beta-hexosaminidase C-terminal domain-containing protein [Leptospirales bacterium]